MFSSPVILPLPSLYNLEAYTQTERIPGRAMHAVVVGMEVYK